MADILARIVCLYRPENDWTEVFSRNLNCPVVRIGRIKQPIERTIIPGTTRRNDCDFYDIDLSFARSTKGYYASKQHATMFKWSEMTDYQIMDGTYSTVTMSNPNPVVVPSSVGVYVNGRRLLAGEKYNLKDKDEIVLFPDRLKLIYLRPQNTIADFLHDTIIPEEYRNQS